MNYKPSAAQVRLLRKILGITQEEAGSRVYSSRLAWQKYELGERQMPASTYELFLLKHRLLEPEDVYLITAEQGEKIRVMFEKELQELARGDEPK